MARKSRRQLNIEKAIVSSILDIHAEERIKAAGYVRLSSDNPETDSIQTQILMIGQYVNEHPEFELVDTYVDNGYSGTSFERPDFQRLMDDIRLGQIQCIIVKDLSRFGRNYIEAGYYIETILPQLNVRLIAINDRFDSSREEDLQGIRLPIKNMVNSLYARDLSKKFCKTYDMRFQTGTNKIREGLYGYILDRPNNVFIEDPKTCGIVKIMFRWAAQGRKLIEIANLLNLVGAELPSDAKLRLENKRVPVCHHEWKDCMIHRILTQQTYTGDTVYGRSRERKCEQVFIRRTDRDQQIVWPNTHVPLVSHRVFEQINKGIEERRKKREESKLNIDLQDLWKNPFEKKLVCKECGTTMLYKRIWNKNEEQQGCAKFVCKHSKKRGCGRQISEDDLKKVVLDQTKNYVRSVCDFKQLAKDLVSGIKKTGKLASLEKKSLFASRKISELEKTLEKLYVDYTEGTIEEDEYKTFQCHYLKKKEELLGNLKEYKRQESELRRRLDRYMDLEERLEPYLNSSEYEQELIDEFIETIYLGENDTIEIVFRCDDVFTQYLDMLKEEKE